MNGRGKGGTRVRARAGSDRADRSRTDRSRSERWGPGQPVRLPIRVYAALLAGTLAVLFAVKRLVGITYFINDDIAMRDIVSGAYTGSPDTHIIFILRPVAVLLKALFSRQPAVDWYALFMIGCHGLCLFVLLVLAARWASAERSAELQADSSGKRVSGPVFPARAEAASGTEDSGSSGSSGRSGGRRPVLTARAAWALPAAAVAFLAVDAHALAMIQFTTAAAALCWTAVAVWLAPRDVLRPLPRTVLAGVLLLMAYNIRPNVCLLSLPFVAVAVWVQLSDAGTAAGVGVGSGADRYRTCGRPQGGARRRLLNRVGTHRRPALIAAAAILALGAVSNAFDAAQYRSEDWQRYRAFNRARAFLYDYVEIPDYRSAAAAYRAAGLTENTVNLIRDYNLMSDPAVTAEQLDRVQAVARAAQQPAGGAVPAAEEQAVPEFGRPAAGDSARDLLQRARAAVQAVLDLSAHERLSIYVFWNLLLLAVSLILSLIVSRSRAVLKTVFQNLLWPVIGFAELVFLAWRGRMPERVAVVPLVLTAAALLTVCGRALWARPARQPANGVGGADDRPAEGQKQGGRWPVRAAVAVLGLSLVLATGLQLDGIREYYSRYTRYHSRYREAVELVTRADPDGVYFYNVGTMDFSFPQMAWRNTPFDGRFLTLGGWRSRSPVQTANWALHGFDTAAGARALLRDGVYFVASDASEAAHIRDYLNEQTGGVRAELTQVIDESGFYFECYRFVRGSG